MFNNTYRYGDKMKTKLAIVTYQMNMGGIEKSLLSFLEVLPKESFDVTIYLLKRGGALFDKLPDHVRIKHVLSDDTRGFDIVKSYVKEGKLLTSMKATYYLWRIKRGVNSAYEENTYTANRLPKQKAEYDVAIAYYIPCDLSVIYTLNNIRAKKRIAWLHIDLGIYQRALQLYATTYEKYDHIFGVSKYIVNQFNRSLPQLAEKTSPFYNIIQKRKLHQLAQGKESFQDTFNGLRILTVGRLSKEKGQDLLPQVVKRLIEEGYDIRWYCIGDGHLRPYLEEAIKKHGIENHLILLGLKQNPYPYFRDCDLYVQPSRYESYCLTVAEARAFHCPIITTNTAASEQIIEDQSGVIVDCNEDALYQAVKRLLEQPKVRKRFRNYLENETINTTSEMTKLYQLLERKTEYILANVKGVSQ